MATGILRLLPVVCFAIVGLLVLGCPLEEPPVPDGIVKIEAVSIDAEGICDVLLSITNTSKEMISHVDLVFQVSTEQQNYYRRITESIAVLPGETMGVIETLSIQIEEGTEISASENVAVLWVSFS